MWGIGIVRIRSEEQGCDNGIAAEETRAYTWDESEIHSGLKNPILSWYLVLCEDENCIISQKVCNKQI